MKMPDDAPRWRRRKTARPGEILDAALTVFAEHGFAAAKLTEIARRAGVSKAALYLYFETKDDLFRAVARSLVASNLARSPPRSKPARRRSPNSCPCCLPGPPRSWPMGGERRL